MGNGKGPGMPPSPLRRDTACAVLWSDGCETLVTVAWTRATGGTVSSAPTTVMTAVGDCAQPARTVVAVRTRAISAKAKRLSAVGVLVKATYSYHIARAVQ